MKNLKLSTLLLLLFLLIESCDLPVVDPVFNVLTLEVLSETQISGTPGETLPPIRLKVTNQDNVAIAGVELKVEVSSGNVDDTQPTTDNQGIATISWTLGDTPGEHTMDISINSSGNSSQKVTALVTQSSYALEVLSEPQLSGTPGETLSPVEVKVTDPDNLPVEDVQLDVEVSSGGVDNSQPRTNSQGIAKIIWTLGQSLGEQRMTISIPNSSSNNNSEQVTAMVTQVSYNLAIVSGEQQFNATAGEPLENPFVVQMIDPSNSTAVSGVVVRFEVVEGNASFAGGMSTSVPTNTEGRASATLTMGENVLDTVIVQARLASNSQVISEPESVQFSSAADRFTDERDGEIYQVVRLLDGKVWMADNLNYTLGGSWCYDNDPANCNEYGRLYTWEAALEACPAGWHLPSDEEWREMAKKYGGVDDDAADDGQAAFEALISAGTSVFDARLGGYRYSNGIFEGIDDFGDYWSITPTNTTGFAWYYSFRRNDGELWRNTFGTKSNGLSCRCVQD